MEKSNKGTGNKGTGSKGSAAPPEWTQPRAEREPVELSQRDVGDVALAVVGDVGAVVHEVAQDADARAAFFGNLEFAPTFLTLTQGQGVRGFFERHGQVESSDEVTDPLSGEIRRKMIPTVVLRCDDGRTMIEFPAAHEITRGLHGVIRGEYVAVERGEDVSVGKKRVTRYLIARTPRGKVIPAQATEAGK